MRFPSLCILFLALLACRTPKPTALDPYRYSINKVDTGSRGAVVSAHPLASQVGLDILKRGGNAVDAAIATQLALAVVYPNAGNLGGGGFLVARLSNGELVSLDYRETAPAKAHRDMYLDRSGEVIPGKSLDGHLSSGVPGTVAGLFESARYAKLPMKVLIQPAMELAEKGFVITAREASSLNGLKSEFLQFNTRPTAFVRDRPWQAGDTLVQTELAQTLRRIGQLGRKGFYEGPTAQLIVEEMQRGGGIITLDDLKAYRAKWRTPLRFPYKGHEIVSMAMPSSGGTLLFQMMKMLEGRLPAGATFQSPATVQLMVEVERRAYADRAEHMGDADFYPVPQRGLLDTTYLRRRMESYRPGIAGKSTEVRPGQPAKRSEETTHLSVIDAEGNAVSVTTTLNNSYGSRTVVGGAGFLLNDEMDDFSSKPGVPNLYGAVGGEANAIAPGKRMLSAMTPTIVLHDGKPYLIVGTPGGMTIPTSVFQTLVNLLEFGMPTSEAVWKPKFHHQWLPDEVYLEKGIAPELREALRGMGYKITERGAIGRVEVIRVLPDGRFEAVADNRGDDAAEAW